MAKNKEFVNNKSNLRIITYAKTSQFASFKHLCNSLGFSNVECYDDIFLMVENYILNNNDIVIIDCDTAGDKTLGFLKIFRSQDVMQLCSSPILALISSFDEFSLDNLIKEGCNDSLLKPFKMAELGEKIENLVVTPHLYNSDSGQLKPVPHFTYNRTETKAKSQDLWVV